MLILDNTNIAVGQGSNVTAWTVTLVGGAGSVTSVAQDVQNAMIDAATAMLQRGAGPAKLKVYTAAFGLLLVTFTAADPAFAAAVAGVATALGTPYGALGINAGTAAKCRVTDSADVMLWEDDVQQAP